MPTMPNVVGLELSAAQSSLEDAGVVNLSLLGYFSTWPITADWVESTLSPFTVTDQSPAASDTVVANSPVILTVSSPPLGVVYP